MTWQTLDSIINSVLLRRKYPVHWYVDFLKYGADIIRELHFDVMLTICSVKLPVTSYKAVILPCGFVDWIRIGIAAGQYVHPMTSEANMNRLNNFDAAGNKIPYADTFPDGNIISTFELDITDANIWGEHQGGIFNHNPGRAGANFLVIRERNEIQLDPDFPYEDIILDYIDDGQGCDAATKIHPYAQAAIEAYIIWQMMANNRGYQPGETALAFDQYDKQQRVLRARLSDLTPDDVTHAARKGYSGTYKGF
jgi:hypothetical protein